MSMPSAADLATCVYCPKLCRHVCPVAVGTAREAAVPSNMALHPFLFLRAQGEVSEAVDAAALCVECGACTLHCDQDRPLGQLLGQLYRSMTAPPQPDSLDAIEGDGRHVAIESDERRWSDSLARHLGSPVARLTTRDHLGADALAHPLADPHHASALRTLLAGRIAVVSDHQSLAAVRAAGAQVVHLTDLVELDGDGPVHHPCQGPRLEGQTLPQALACCGARGPLAARHPQLSADVAASQARRMRADQDDDQPLTLRSPDTTCACALRAAGLDVVDPVDALFSTQA